MFVLAHIMGVPVEEFIIPLATSGVGAAIVLLAQAWLRR
jgi:hypothetical protein